jgi:hypothetical protein
MASGGSAGPRRMADLASADSLKGQNAGAQWLIPIPDSPGKLQLVHAEKKKKRPKRGELVLSAR